MAGYLVVMMAGYLATQKAARMEMKRVGLTAGNLEMTRGARWAMNLAEMMALRMDALTNLAGYLVVTLASQKLKDSQMAAHLAYLTMKGSSMAVYLAGMRVAKMAYLTRKG